MKYFRIVLKNFLFDLQHNGFKIAILAIARVVFQAKKYQAWWREELAYTAKSRIDNFKTVDRDWLNQRKKNELEILKYFTPIFLKVIEVKDSDIKKYFEWSEKGKHKEEAVASSYKRGDYTGFDRLIQSKRWAGIHVHELYEPGVLEGSLPYYCLLGGDDKQLAPYPVVNWLKKEMFKGIDSKIIEDCYTMVLEESKTW